MISSFGNPIGTIFGTVIPPLVVDKDEYTTADDRALGIDQTFHYIIVQSSIATALFVFTIVFFRDKPKIAPR